MRTFILITILSLGQMLAFSQPEVPIEQWTDKTILLIGAHPDDDAYSMGTLGMLHANGNDVHVVIMTTGNVGTQDPDLSMGDLARIRTQEELAALATMGITSDHYSNLGYDDGMLEYENKKEFVSRLVRLPGSRSSGRGGGRNKRTIEAQDRVEGWCTGGGFQVLLGASGRDR